MMQAHPKASVIVGGVFGCPSLKQPKFSARLFSRSGRRMRDASESRGHECLASRDGKDCRHNHLICRPFLEQAM